MATIPAGTARVRRRVAGHRRVRAAPPGVLAVSPDQRSTAVLVGITILALLVAAVVTALGVARWTAPDAFDTQTVLCVDDPSFPC